MNPTSNDFDINGCSIRIAVNNFEVLDREAMCFVDKLQSDVTSAVIVRCSLADIDRVLCVVVFLMILL